MTAPRGHGCERHAANAPIFVLVLALAGCLACNDTAHSPEAAATKHTTAGTAADLGADTVASGAGASGADDRYVAVLVPHEAVDIKTKEPGDLTAVLVRPGDRVSAGDTVAELDLLSVREELTIARTQTLSAKATLEQSEVDIAASERALEIEQNLTDKGIGAQKNVEEARFARDRARKTKQRAIATLAEKQAAVDQLLRRLQEAHITAPFDGAVALRYRDPGTVVAAGTPIVRLIRVDELWARFAIPAAHATRIAVGDRVRVAVESIPGWLPATVRHISPELDGAAQMIFVDAWLAIPEHRRGVLRAGLPAWVTRDDSTDTDTEPVPSPPLLPTDARPGPAPSHESIP